VNPLFCAPKAGVAKLGDYEEVQVPLDTFVVGGSTIPGET
jgi:hypothetical protein